MNPWYWAAIALMLALVPCGWATFRGTTMERAVALDAVSTVVALLLLALSELLHRSILLDLALTVAVFTVAGGLVFARFLERWL